ncbi:DUF3040 domain-containing protein [Halostreptopolyspora alba]|uniref:DUF3040 domain-containing protein n=1 Tax=Halostreptopolyspora alba TaxID=2487137 RepID=A0A3N0E200_9ACTN|nr:DUF3040 domain-containing protein [Nocardiopsaceae bacterium YIM 96095]
MATPRYDNERLRAIEEYLRDEDPGYVRRVERSAADLPEQPAPPDEASATQSTFVLVCAWVIGTILVLVLVVSLADAGNRDFASEGRTTGATTTEAEAGSVPD